MRIYSHRGVRREPGVRENTQAAFAAAVVTGVEGIETDVQLTADGRLILLHDLHTPTGRPVVELTRSELEAELGFQVPEVEEALMQWPALTWNLEVKLPAAVDLLIPLLQKYHPKVPLLITSFWHDVIARIARSVDVMCGLLTYHRPADLAYDIAAWRALPNVRVLAWFHAFVDGDLIAQARAGGMTNAVWGVRFPRDHERCYKIGADLIITDFPEMARAVVLREQT